MIKVSCIVDAGVNNKHTNDDRALIDNIVVSNGELNYVTDRPLLLAVFDGVGGEHFGYEAASIGAKGLASSPGTKWDKTTVSHKLLEINESIVERQWSDICRRGMSSTVSGIAINEDGYVLFNVGDSKVFRFRNGFFQQLTTEDSAGDHFITKWLGMDGLVPYVEEVPRAVFPGDIFVICTDGVSDYVPDDEFKHEITYLINCDCIEEACDSLITYAIKNGSKDNCTIIIAKVV